jgi:hypothetical protein
LRLRPLNPVRMTAPLTAGRLPGTPSNHFRDGPLGAGLVGGARLVWRRSRLVLESAHSRIDCGRVGVHAWTTVQALARDLPGTAPRVPSRRPLAQSSAPPFTWAVVWAREVLRGVVNYPHINGMQGVRGSNPLSSTPGQRPFPPSTARESPASGSKSAAISPERPIQRPARRCRRPASLASSPGGPGPTRAAAGGPVRQGRWITDRRADLIFIRDRRLSAVLTGLSAGRTTP